LDTVNIVLMVVLSAMIGFAIGNSWGRYAMKQMIINLLTQFIGKAQKAASQDETQKGE